MVSIASAPAAREYHTAVWAGSEEQRSRAFKAGASAYVCAASGPEALCEELRALFEYTEVQSKRARVEEERAIQEELERRLAVALDRSARARQLAAGATERAARAKAYERFTHAGGSPANFERWWPALFSSSAANYLAPRGQHGNAKRKS